MSAIPDDIAQGTAEWGAGPAAVFLHSSGFSPLQWKGVAPLLAPWRRIIAPPFSGAFGAVPWTGGYEGKVAADVERVERLIAALGEPVDLVGHSYGGYAALLVAVRGRVPLRSLAALEPVAFGTILRDPACAVYESTMGLFGTGFLDPAVGGSEPWLQGFIDYWNGAGAFARIREPLRSVLIAQGKTVFAEVYGVSTDPVHPDAYAAVRVPTLLLAGGASTAEGRYMARAVAAAIPGATHAEIEAGGHMFPAAFARETARHLARFWGIEGGP